ncbi:MAG: transposase, partial [Pseudomonadota bacterium]
VYTDGLFAFRRFVDAGHAHTVLETSGGRAATEVKGARWVNIVLSNVKRSISGVYHSIRQGKYARRYLGEAAYRFNRRFQLSDMLPRLVHAMIQCSPRPEPRLRLASNFRG